MEEEVRETTDTTLFEGEGEEEDEEEALETLEGEQVRGIHTIRQKNRVSIGVPISLPLGPLLQQRGQSLPVDILLQLQAYEFYQIQLACSFEAGDHYRFHEARFQLTLETHPVAAGISGTPPAIAYDLFPLQLDDQRQVSIKRSLNPEIKFNFNQSKAALPSQFMSVTKNSSIIKTVGAEGDMLVVLVTSSGWPESYPGLAQRRAARHWPPAWMG